MSELTILRIPIAVLVFTCVGCSLYWLGGRIAPKGEQRAGKRQPYACGEDLAPPDVQLSYQAFFHLALMFGVLHLSALVVSTLPVEAGPQRMAMLYLGGVAVSVFVLAWGEL